ncbi:MAG: phosphate ABC transporter ATP-binding protein [Chloroflexi bacterium]|nr:phosphate ABC transporter ATP-binding protein [Chloroflexota bacterium]MYI82351.1 phosphate ABC transporter ATP-binding protein [Chloroflexota bacterium]
MVGNVTDEAERTAASAAARAAGVSVQAGVRATEPEPAAEPGIAVEMRNISLWYGQKQAVGNVSLDVPRNRVTALIGPSGCGKSTLLRCINRMNDLIDGVRIEGEVMIDGANIYAPNTEPSQVRRHVGMVFQKPNPFPKSIYDNVAFGAKINGYTGNMDDLVEESLTKAALWDEVKHELKKSGLALSGGQQQRLCIARAIAVNPEIVLMDEPCSALDPIATQRIEDLMLELANDYTIVVVTHNMQQAARVSHKTAFMLAEDDLVGRLIEFSDTDEIFLNPQDSRTEEYITGRFG